MGRLLQRSWLQRTLCAALVLGGCVLVLPGGSAWGQTPAEVRDKTVAVGKAINEARGMFVRADYPGSSAKLAEVDKMWAELAGMNSPDAKRSAENLDRQIVGLRKLLEGKGVKLAERAKPGAAPAANPAGTPAAGTPAAPAATGGASFTKDVAPILVGKCARCHLGAAMRGNFSADNFTALMRGANGAKMVEPGNGKGSRLYEVLESGDMPRGSGKLSALELASIEKWIDAGAKFDGPNPNATLASLAPTAATAAPQARLEVSKATGNEKVSYQRDIAPVLAASCVGCHGDGQNPSGDLRLTPFTALLRGGDNGVLFTPGKGADSYLVKKLRGTGGGDRMPRRRPPLSDDVIVKFETWINEGAKFDGPEASMPTAIVAATYVATQMTHEELAAARQQTALKNWELGNPEDKPVRVETEHFSVIGNTIESRLQEIGEAAEARQKEVARYFGVPDGQRLFKGKLTLFVFQRRFEYSEFTQMVERRKVPTDLRTHWYYDVIDNYACIPPPADGDTVESLLSEVIAGAYVQSAGKTPTWFHQGAGRAVAAALDAKNPKVKEWDSSLPGIMAGNKPEMVLQDGGFSMSEAPVVSYSFVKFLLSKKASFTAVVASVRKGTEFDQALKSSYGFEANRLVAAWAASAGRR